MAQFLTTRGVSSSIEEVIKGAESKLFILSPYLRIPRDLLERLKDADRKRVNTTVIYGKKELDSDERDKLRGLANLTLYYCENLHAKCYFNEHIMVITSMNMHQFSEQNNREMGVLISREGDKEMFERAREEASSVLRISQADELEKRVADSVLVREAKSQRYTRKVNGFCIRCGRKVNYDPAAPYCRGCYFSWDDYQNPFYEEQHCHRCGKAETTSMNKPLCKRCFQETK